MKRLCLVCLTIVFISFLGAESLYSPTWGFRLDLPEGYELSGGDKKNSFSFSSSFGSSLDLMVYTDRASVAALADDLEKRLSNQGKKHNFSYNGREAAVLELRFTQGRNTFTGWALCMGLEAKAYLAAIAYGPDKPELQCLHLSVLDSIEGGEGDRRLPGAMTQLFHPRGGWITSALANSKETARFRENDAAAAQSVVDREYQVMKGFYLTSPRWQEAWKRFYRAIYKDSFDRLENAAFLLERSWNNSVLGPSGTEEDKKPEEAERLGTRSEEAKYIAAKALEWVQGFKYERDLLGSDFINLITAAREGRGDCDSRAMLWVIILSQSNISAGIMVSREFSHAMGLADLEGQGARFPMKDGNDREIRWLVAETTAQVALGLIEESVSEVTKWLGITFE
ncbi:MAG: hypothetical protein LBH07_08630 [Treponema sp.]|jgi:hypothetical protein|nr:hypothetical protein [Treponema sp.]